MLVVVVAEGLALLLAVASLADIEHDSIAPHRRV